MDYPIGDFVDISSLVNPMFDKADIVATHSRVQRNFWSVSHVFAV